MEEAGAALEAARTRLGDRVYRVAVLDLDARVNIVPTLPGPSFIMVSSFASNVRRALSARADIDVVHNQIRPFSDGVVTVGGGCHAEYLEKVKGPLAVLNPLNRIVLNMEKAMYREGGCKAVITPRNRSTRCAPL